MRVRQAIGCAIAAARATPLPGFAGRSRNVAGLQDVDDDVGDTDLGRLMIEKQMIAAILRDLKTLALSR